MLMLKRKHQRNRLFSEKNKNNIIFNIKNEDINEELPEMPEIYGYYYDYTKKGYFPYKTSRMMTHSDFINSKNERLSKINKKIEQKEEKPNYYSQIHKQFQRPYSKNNDGKTSIKILKIEESEEYSQFFISDN